MTAAAMYKMSVHRGLTYIFKTNLLMIFTKCNRMCVIPHNQNVIQDVEMGEAVDNHEKGLSQPILIIGASPQCLISVPCLLTKHRFSKMLHRISRT